MRDIAMANRTSAILASLMAADLIALPLEMSHAGDQRVSSSTRSEMWNDLKTDVYGSRAIIEDTDIVAFTAPFRPDDQTAVPVQVKAKFKDGRTIKRITVIIDENPSPVAADFDIGGQRSEVSLAAKFRLNRATNMRAVIEASDGQLYMASQFVRFAGGQAACSAPPNGDPAEIAANMGKMRLQHEGATASNAKPTIQSSSLRRAATLDISHPNHTGMVLDQISLLYIPLRMVTDIEVSQGEDRVFAMKGSISLAQDPSIKFDYRPNGSEKLRVKLRDSDEAIWKRDFPIGTSS
ncbi:MAG: quinoprotein dehydrogenase-associated SoxYZ-like carrier [Pseudomonadota bacterium]